MQTNSLEILEKSELPTGQARAILQVVDLEIASHEKALATRSDLNELGLKLELKIEVLKGELKSQFEALRGELRTEVKGGESRLSRWVLTCFISFTAAQTAVLAGAMYFALAHLKH